MLTSFSLHHGYPTSSLKFIPTTVKIDWNIKFNNLKRFKRNEYQWILCLNPNLSSHPHSVMQRLRGGKEHGARGASKTGENPEISTPKQVLNLQIFALKSCRPQHPGTFFCTKLSWHCLISQLFHFSRMIWSWCSAVLFPPAAPLKIPVWATDTDHSYCHLL